MLSLLAQLDAIKSEETLDTYVNKSVTILDLQRILGLKSSTSVYGLFRKNGLDINTIKIPNTGKGGVTTRILVTKDLVKKLTQVNQEPAIVEEIEKAEIPTAKQESKAFSEVKSIFQDLLGKKFHLQHFREAWSMVSSKYPEYFSFDRGVSNGSMTIAKVRTEHLETVKNLLLQEYESIYVAVTALIKSRKKKN